MKGNTRGNGGSVRPAAEGTSLGMRMVLGALGGMGAATCCHPLDVIRVQMQIDGEGKGQVRQFKNPLDAAVKIAQRNGVVKGLYTGIDAAYLRQWTYGSCRVGIYAFLLERANKSANGAPLPFWKKLLMGCTSGAIGSFVGCPTEVALIRMSADSKSPPELKRNYKNVFDCLTRMYKEEGLSSLWKGGLPTIIRATLLSSAVLGCYSEAKEQLHSRFPNVFPHKDGIPLMFSATMAASLVATGVSNPFDVVKSRLQNMPRPEPGQPPKYTSMPDCFAKSVKGEGILVLGRGFLPAFIKLAPYTTISLILTDKLSKALTGKSAM